MWAAPKPGLLAALLRDHPPNRRHTVPVDVLQEHAVLVRHMGRLQARVSAVLADKETQLQALSAEILRLRGQLMVARTAVSWGLTWRATATHSPLKTHGRLENQMLDKTKSPLQ